MCKNDCCCRGAPMRRCCCGCGPAGIGVMDKVLYEGVIDSVGTFTLADDINSYDDVIISHESVNAGGSYSRQSFYSLVSCLGNSNLVCHGNSSVSRGIEFNFSGSKFNVLNAIDNYRIVKIIGRKQIKENNTMCKNECNGRDVTINVCGCCGSGNGEGAGITDTVLYDGIIDALGSYTLNDDINQYNDVLAIHEAKEGGGRQSLCIPVSCLSDSVSVCHGNGGLSAYVCFNIENDTLNVIKCEAAYRIVKIIGRKFN